MLTVEQEKLFNDNLRLVDYVIYRNFRHEAIFIQIKEDLQQEGLIALLLTVQKYDPSRGYQFTTYAVRNIYGYCKQYIDSKAYGWKLPRRSYFKGTEDELQHLTNSLKHNISLHTKVNLHQSQDENKSIEFTNVINTEDIPFEDKIINKQLLENAIKFLPEKDKALLLDYYVEEKDQCFLAEKYGHTQACISRRLKKSLLILREVLQTAY